MSFEEAAAVGDGVILAVNLMRPLDLREGRRVVVYGASGSIGTAAVQVAKHFGAHVTAVCNTPNVDVVRSLGPDEVVDHMQEDFTKNGETYDAVFDAVGKLSFGHCRGSLKPGGLYVSSDLGYLWQNTYLPLVTWPLRRKVKFPVPRYRKRELLFVKELIEAGGYRAVIDRTYPLEDVVEATRYVETEQKTGNVVLTL
jgi:NADPH:quinone reductase-like Zn-dependent oxidoreductase